MKKTNNKGFSLVELIVVIAIMAVLVGVMAPQFLKYVERARKSTDVQNVASIVTALQTYAADPMTTAALSSGTITISTTPTAVSATNCKNNSNLALIAAGINSIGMRSELWNAGAAVVLTITVGTDGSLSVAQTTPAASTTLDVVNGIYQ